MMKARIAVLHPGVKDSDRRPKQPAADVLATATPGDKGAAARDRLARDCRLGDDGHAPTPHERSADRQSLPEPSEGSARAGLKPAATLRLLKEVRG
jgi:hypothetical protein